MSYAFIIDNRKCIGCHACSTACKSENEVPLGVYRTWVKYVEKGRFPNTRRFFQVTRCNHCANPPCVRICPVTAMYQRVDGIVDFDPRICIGCKACLQACPYDAIYVDPDNGTAAKCHYCAHRTEIGLEPACVVVCPERAIISGDLNDPASEISQLLGRHDVSVRKPEQGTAPRLFYIDADEVTLTPTASHINDTFTTVEIASEQARAINQIDRWRGQETGHSAPLRGNGAPRTAHSGAPIRTPTAQGVGTWAGPIQMGEGRMAEQMVQTAYNAQHKIPWHWPVPAYLVTKSIGSGVFMLLALIFGLGIAPFSRGVALLGTMLSLEFIGLTTALLVWDLERPERFYAILTRPQWKSWLTRGSFMLIGFSLVAGGWLALESLGGLASLVDLVIVDRLIAFVRPLVLLAGFILAVASAIYTAFLFGQAEGRDLWQGTLLPAHLFVQALMVGAGTLLVVGVFVRLPAGMNQALLWTFGASLLTDLGVTLLGELGMPHASEVAARATHEISHGRYRWHFWAGSVALGHILPLLLLGLAALIGAGQVVLGAVGGLGAIVGLFVFEYAFVMAPQEIPNS
ncbi:MAG: NrfD/PsrC family molybdoenzyme membrane anchor subunit [Anaerolineae bacterium]